MAFQKNVLKLFEKNSPFNEICVFPIEICFPTPTHKMVTDIKIRYTKMFSLQVVLLKYKGSVS